MEITLSLLHFEFMHKETHSKKTRETIYGRKKKHFTTIEETTTKNEFMDIELHCAAPILSFPLENCVPIRMQSNCASWIFVKSSSVYNAWFHPFTSILENRFSQSQWALTGCCWTTRRWWTIWSEPGCNEDMKKTKVGRYPITLWHNFSKIELELLLIYGGRVKDFLSRFEIVKMHRICNRQMSNCLFKKKQLVL